MSIFRFRRSVSALFAVAVSSTACAQKADFNQVARDMAIMLQNSHYSRVPFVAKLGEQFLDDFIRDLDYNRVYFTQKDIDRFKAAYGDRLHSMLLQYESMTAAQDIYATFQERVEARVADAKSLLDGPDFDFTQDETVLASRKDAAWPKDEAEAKIIWRQQIKEAVLAETLRRDMLAKMAADQGKPDPTKGDREPKEKIRLRYERLLHSVKDDVDDEEIANYFLSSVARSYDPHTDYMSYREMNRFKDGMRNELVGIGALLQIEEDGATKITGIVVNGPADREGTLKLNDRIVAVGSPESEEMTDVMFMKIDRVVDLIRGKANTAVKLKVEPAGGAPGETKMVTIVRDKVELKDEQASAEIIEMRQPDGATCRLGWITLPSFYADFDDDRIRCASDVESLLKRLNQEKIDGLIFDLRNNGGGSLEEVRRMTGFFINRGPVVQVKNTIGQVQVKDADNKPPLFEGPMVVLIDKSSASASEIFAGALQDYNRAVIVGDSSTFGKGTVQQPMDIGKMMPVFASRDRAGFLKVTIQKFYRPSGSSTQLEGVASDIALPSLSDAVEIGERYLERALPHDRIRPASDFNQMPKADLFLPRLLELSQKRVSENKDFRYLKEDVEKAKARIAENKVSLNIANRQKDLEEADQTLRDRNAERAARFKEIQVQDSNLFKFYKLTLDNVKKEGLTAYDPSLESEGNMRKAKDKTDDLDQTPRWPSGLDPVKRESLMILRDLIDTTDNARMAGMIQKSTGSR
jgi:carboxyl-terminal processing protease